MDLGTELKRLGKNIRKDAAMYRQIVRDKRTPVFAKLLIAAALTYAFAPLDVLSEFTVMPAVLVLAMKMVPSSVIIEASMKSAQAAAKEKSSDSKNAGPARRGLALIQRTPHDTGCGADQRKATKLGRLNRLG